MYEISYHPKVLSHDLVKISKTDLKALRNAIERKLTTRPEMYGAHLRGELASYWKIRVGDYRIVYQISGKSIYVLVIANRKDVYTQAGNRA